MFSQVSVCPQRRAVSAPLHVGIHLSGLEADTPLGRHPSADTPWTDTPLGRHHHGQTPPRQTPPMGRHPPGQTPPGQTHPCPVHAGIHTPLPSACWDTHPPAQCMLGYTPPCPVHDGIRSTSRRYASYWNTFLLLSVFCLNILGGGGDI